MSESQKAAIRRFVRVFLSSFLVIFSTQVANLETQGIVKAGIDEGILSFLNNLWLVMIYPALLSATAGAISATFKYLRDEGLISYKSPL